MRRWMRQAQNGAFKSERALRALIVGILLFTITITLYLFLTRRCPDANRLPTTSLDLPGYLTSAWPTPNTKLPRNCYLQSLRNGDFYSGVGVEIISVNIDGWSREVQNSPLPSRVQLFLNSQLIANERIRVGLTGLERIITDPEGITHSLGDAGYTLSWDIELEPGKYIATIEITSIDDQLFTFSWDFIIIQ